MIQASIYSKLPHSIHSHTHHTKNKHSLLLSGVDNGKSKLMQTTKNLISNTNEKEKQKRFKYSKNWEINNKLNKKKILKNK